VLRFLQGIAVTFWTMFNGLIGEVLKNVPMTNSYPGMQCRFRYQTFKRRKRLNTSCVRGSRQPADQSRSQAEKAESTRRARAQLGRLRRRSKVPTRGLIWRHAVRVASHRETSRPASSSSGLPSAVTPFCPIGRRTQQGRNGTWGMAGV